MRMRKVRAAATAATRPPRTLMAKLKSRKPRMRARATSLLSLLVEAWRHRNLEPAIFSPRRLHPKFHPTRLRRLETARRAGVCLTASVTVTMVSLCALLARSLRSPHRPRRTGPQARQEIGALPLSLRLGTRTLLSSLPRLLLSRMRFLDLQHPRPPLRCLLRSRPLPRRRRLLHSNHPLPPRRPSHQRKGISRLPKQNSQSRQHHLCSVPRHLLRPPVPPPLVLGRLRPSAVLVHSRLVARRSSVKVNPPRINLLQHLQLPLLPRFLAQSRRQRRRPRSLRLLRSLARSLPLLSRRRRHQHPHCLAPSLRRLSRRRRNLLLAHCSVRSPPLLRSPRSPHPQYSAQRQRRLGTRRRSLPLSSSRATCSGMLPSRARRSRQRRRQAHYLEHQPSLRRPLQRRPLGLVLVPQQRPRLPLSSLRSHCSVPHLRSQRA